jgi:uncharacterized protein
VLPLIEERRSEIADICRRFGVRRLAVFGSAARGEDFDPERSDVDFLVAFEPREAPRLDTYIGLKDSLEALFGRSVDLVEPGRRPKPLFQSEHRALATTRL